MNLKLFFAKFDFEGRVLTFFKSNLKVSPNILAEYLGHISHISSRLWRHCGGNEAAYLRAPHMGAGGSLS